MPVRMGALIVSVLFAPVNVAANVTEPAEVKSRLPPPVVVPMVIELALVSKVRLVNDWFAALVTGPLSTLLNTAVSAARGTAEFHEPAVFHSPPDPFVHVLTAA